MRKRKNLLNLNHPANTWLLIMRCVNEKRAHGMLNMEACKWRWNYKIYTQTGAVSRNDFFLAWENAGFSSRSLMLLP
jgi:hypothetical protein